MFKFYPRILRIPAGILMMLFLGAMYAWSYFKVELAACFPAWSQANITLNFTIMMSCFCIGGLTAGNVLKRVSKPLQIIIAAVLISVGFLGTSLLPEQPEAALTQLYLCYGVMTGIGTGIAYNAVLAGIQPWYPKHPGLISGVLLMCLGFGSLLLGNLAAIIAETWSIFAAFRLMSILTFVVLALGAGAAAMPEAGAGVSETAVTEGNGRQFEPRELLRRPSFWLCFFWNVCTAAGGMLVINSASSIALHHGLVPTIGLLVSVCNGFGRFLLGHSIDRFGWRKSLFFADFLLLGGGALLLCGEYAKIAALVLPGMLLVGACYGGGVTMIVALVRKLYGDKHYASNLALCDLSLFPAAIMGPMISAVLLDSSGTYHSTFIVVIIFSLLAFVITSALKKA